jgi:endonuclease YncB( thermonuclease family)
MIHLLALLLVLTATSALAEPPRVLDGDTLELSTGERVRLWGIDAVEGDQICQRNGYPWQCGDDGEFICTEVDRDRYGRTVATCSVNGQDIGSAMVRSGWALDYERYSGGAYLGEQLDAIQAQRGLWSGSFVPPWEWRAR